MYVRVTGQYYDFSSFYPRFTVLSSRISSEQFAPNPCEIKLLPASIVKTRTLSNLR